MVLPLRTGAGNETALRGITYREGGHRRCIFDVQPAAPPRPARAFAFMRVSILFAVCGYARATGNIAYRAKRCRSVASDGHSGLFASGLTYPKLSRNNSGGVLFGGTRSDGNHSLLIAEYGVIHTIANTYDDIPGRRAERFAAVDAVADSSGGVVFRGRDAKHSGGSGIYAGMRPNFEIVADVSCTMPGATANTKFGAFGRPVIADTGAVFFGGWDAADWTTSKWKGIYRARSGIIEKVADVTDQHPTRGLPFSMLEAPAVDAAETVVAFFASVQTPAPAPLIVAALPKWDRNTISSRVGTSKWELEVVVQYGEHMPPRIMDERLDDSEKFMDFSVPVVSWSRDVGSAFSEGSSAITVAFTGAGSHGSQGIFVWQRLNSTSHTNTSARATLLRVATSGRSTPIIDVAGKKKMVVFQSFPQPPSVVAHTKQVMFLAVTDPPENTGIFLAESWGSGNVTQVAAVAPPPLAAACCHGTDGGLEYVGFQDGSFDGSRFAWYGTGPENSSIYETYL